MTARPEERDRPYEIVEESDVIRMDVIRMSMIRTDAINLDTEEMDVTIEEIDMPTIPPVTSNDLWGLPPSARR